MPRRDGTGPMGAGSTTGRGLGVCAGMNTGKYGAGMGPGLGCRRGSGGGFGRSFAANQAVSMPKEHLQAQKDVLQRRLEEIDKQLEN